MLGEVTAICGVEFARHALKRDLPQAHSTKKASELQDEDTDGFIQRTEYNISLG
jgi:hypothetical protein